MKNKAFALGGGLAAWLLAGGPALGAQQMGCLIEPQLVADVGSPIIGVIETVLVDRGDRVTKGQVLARLHSDVERAAVAVADSRARAEADEQSAQASLEFARQKLERARNLLERKFISQQGLDQAQTEYELARQKAAQAAEQKRTTVRELGFAQAQLSQHVIRSPFDGIVAERYLAVGERVEEKPLFRVAKIDPLKVQVVVPAAFYGKVRAGMVATVQPQLPDAAPAQARVTLVDKLIDGPSNTFRVQLELPNPSNALPAGLRCRTDLGLPMPADGSPATPAPALRPALLKVESTPPEKSPSASGAPKRSW